VVPRLWRHRRHRLPQRRSGRAVAGYKGSDLFTRWAHDCGNAGWRYGVEKGWLQDLVRYWTEDFDWRAQEDLINAFPQYRVEIDGVPIHYLHVRGWGRTPRP
jgi:hypothetical protein